MADNKGIYPLVPGTPVGDFRLMIGDVSSEPYNPAVPGFQNYTLFSDSEIEVFLAQAEDSLEGAAYFAYTSLAGAAALASKSVADLDLKIDTTKRASDLLALARLWRERWELGTADIFEVFDIGGSGCGCVPEGTPAPLCRRGCNGSGLF